MPDQYTRRAVLRKGSLAAGTVGLGSTAGCTGVLPGSDGAVTVGSKQFTEQALLGYMSVEALKANVDATIESQVKLGGTVTNFEALKNDDISMYWEYTGTAWATLPPKHSEVITDPQKIYEKVAEEFKSEYDIELLDRAPFNNTYVLCANPDWANETGVKTLSGLAEHVNGGNTDFTVVMNAEFQERADGWPGLLEHYGFADAAKNLDVRNVESGLTYQIIGEGEAAVGMGFNTNPQILKHDLRVLEDDEQFFPVYNPAPMVRSEALESTPEIEAPLNEVAGALDTETIRELNRRVSIGGEEAKAVATDYLKSENIV